MELRKNSLFSSVCAFLCTGKQTTAQLLILWLKNKQYFSWQINRSLCARRSILYVMIYICNCPRSSVDSTTQIRWSFFSHQLISSFFMKEVTLYSLFISNCNSTIKSIPKLKLISSRHQIWIVYNSLFLWTWGTPGPGPTVFGFVWFRLLWYQPSKTEVL